MEALIELGCLGEKEMELVCTGPDGSLYIDDEEHAECRVPVWMDTETGIYLIVMVNRLPMTNGIADKLGLTGEQAFELAKETSLGELRINSMKNLFGDIVGENDMDIFVLSTNDRGIRGASALTLPGIKERLSEKAGGSYYVIPSSIHEVLILPSDSRKGPGDENVLVGIVKMLNRNRDIVGEGEVLSNNILFYDNDMKNLSFIFA